MNIVYFLQRKDYAIKIGTTGDFYTRFQHLVKKHGELLIIGAMEGSRQQESALQSIFSDFRIGYSDWFRDCVEIHNYASRNTSIDLRPYQARLDEALCIKTGRGTITDKQKSLIAQARRKPVTFAEFDKLHRELEAAKAEIQALTTKVEHGGRRPYGDESDTP